jgi:hypothetical protein
MEPLKSSADVHEALDIAKQSDRLPNRLNLIDCMSSDCYWWEMSQAGDCRKAVTRGSSQDEA